MRVRPAEVRDLPRILAIERESGTAAHWTEQNYRDLFSAGVNGVAPTSSADHTPPLRLCLVVELASESPATGRVPNPAAEAELLIAGFAVVFCIGTEWEIENIAVDSALRRRGCGRLLLSELCRSAAKKGAQEIHLEVRESNRAARAFYAQSGFREAGRRRRYYARPEEDAVLLVRSSHKGSLENG